VNIPEHLRRIIDVKVTRLWDAADQLEQALDRLPASGRRHVAPGVEALGLAIEEIERRLYR
jgi:hypothetical protein